MALYQLTDAGVCRDGSVYIPNDPNNPWWQDYLAWLAAGNTPDPMPMPPVPVSTVTGSQVIGALADAQAAQVKLRDLLRIAGDPSVPVTNPKLVRISTTLGMTPAVLFTAAQGA